MKTSMLVDIFDLYGQGISLQVFGEEKKKSAIGAVMGVLSMAAIAAISIYFLMTLFTRDTKQIIQSNNYSLIPQNNLSSFMIAMGFQTPRAAFLPPESGYWDIKVNLVKTKWANYTFLGTETIPLEVRKCSNQDAGNFNYPSATLALGLCVHFGKYDLSINGKIGDLINGWTNLDFLLLKCNPNMTSNCKSRSEIDNVFEGGAFTVGTVFGTIDNDNNLNPNQQLFFPYGIYTSNSLYKEVTLSLIQNLYTDDSGFVFESLETHNFFTMGGLTTSYNLNRPVYVINAKEKVNPFAKLSIYNNPFVTTTKRTYLKAQTILANIGGVMKFFMVVSEVITQFINRKSIFTQIGNAVFTYGETKVENKKSKPSVKMNNNFVSLEDRDNVSPINEVNTRQRKSTINFKEKTTNTRVAV